MWHARGFERLTPALLLWQRDYPKRRIEDLTCEAQHDEDDALPPGEESKRHLKIRRPKRALSSSKVSRSQLRSIESDRYEVMTLLAAQRGCRSWHQCLYPSRLLKRRIPARARSRPSCHYSTSRLPNHGHDPNTQTTRNIGIIAHIDAVSKNP